MEYGHIVQRAFHIAWRYKALWIFGLFAAGSSSFNLDLNQYEFGPSSTGTIPMINPDLFTPELVLSLLAIGFIFFVLFTLAFCISNPALVDATNRIERGGRYSFGASFSAGIDYFARSLGLWIVVFACTAAVILGGVFLIIFFFALADSAGGGGGEAALLGVLGILALIPVFFVLYFVSYTLGSLAQRAMVVRDIGIGESLAEGWYLLRNNIMSSVVIFLIFIGISMGLAFISAIVFLSFNALVHLFVTPAGVGFQAYLVIALIVGLPISLILGGFFGTFFSNVYTLYYFELVDPSGPRPATMTGPASPTGPGPAGARPPGGPTPNAPLPPAPPETPAPPEDPDKPKP